MVTKDTPFIGKFKGNAQDLINQFARYNTNHLDRAKRLAPIYIKWGKVFNLRADLAWCQMEHETGFLEFEGDVSPNQNNFVGIGATGGVPGNSFKTEELGVIAQYAHLAWYYYEDHVNKYCSKEYDPRHFGSYHYKYTGDTSLDFLSGQWAVPGRYEQPDGSIITYGGQIARLADEIEVTASSIQNPIEKWKERLYYALNVRTDIDWQYIAIHHSVSDQFKTSMKQIRQWHLARNFLREGYHFGINGKGKYELGRPLSMPGAHVRGWNDKAVGICLYGDFRYTEPTTAQLMTAFELIHRISFQFAIDVPKNVLGHNEFPDQSTLCPVIDMNQFRAELDSPLSQK